jgi:branched-chain amino acid aminotransferase
MARGVTRRPSGRPVAQWHGHGRWLLAGIRSGACTELFACGTAAIVSPIAVLADSDGQEYQPRQTNEVAKRLRESLLAIQERRAPDPFGWTRELI